MEKFFFTKMTGAGTDFIILDNFPIIPDPVLIQKLCDRRNGIGADGLITISVDQESDFRMVYYNSDGFPGSLCGNGARCAIKYAKSTGKIKGNYTKFIAGSKYYAGEILDDGLIKFYLEIPSVIKRNIIISLGNKNLTVSFADTGSPHVVVFIEEVTQYFGKKYNMNEIPIDRIGKEIRHNKEFSPGGANVNFISYEKDKLFIRTFERGVESETLACGTGSVASAIISFLENIIEPPVTLITRSGEELKVDFNFQNNNFLND